MMCGDPRVSFRLLRVNQFEPVRFQISQMKSKEKNDAVSWSHVVKSCKRYEIIQKEMQVYVYMLSGEMRFSANSGNSLNWTLFEIPLGELLNMNAAWIPLKSKWLNK